MKDDHVSIRFDQKDLAKQYYRLRQRMLDSHPELAKDICCYRQVDTAEEATHAYPTDLSGPNGEILVVLLKPSHPEVCSVIVLSSKRNDTMKNFYDEVVAKQML